LAHCAIFYPLPNNPGPTPDRHRATRQPSGHKRRNTLIPVGCYPLIPLLHGLDFMEFAAKKNIIFMNAVKPFFFRCIVYRPLVTGYDDVIF
jgi:hypothetical protein